MSLEFNAENRNANMPIRRCSFCRRAGHNITRCNSQAIGIFERETLNYIEIIIITQIPSRIENLRHHLLNEAIYDSNLLRAFAIRRCGANTRTNMASCIDLIIQYFMPVIQSTQTRYQNIQEARAAEQAQSAEPLQRRDRIFDLSELTLPYLEMNGQRIFGVESSMMFFEMIRSINNINSLEARLDRKFNIKTKISEKQDDLEEKCECNICYEESEKQHFVKYNCGHEFCKDCIKKSLQNESKIKPCCAFCRADITNFEFKTETIKNEFNDLITSEIV